MRPMRLSFDVLNAEGLIAYAERLKRHGYYFAAMTFVGNTQAGAARAFKDFSPQTRVIYRPYPDRDLPTRFPDPRHFYQWVEDELEGDDRLAVQVMNEPDLRDEEALGDYIDWVLRAIPTSTARSWVSVFWNWGTGHPVLKNAHELLHPVYLKMQGKDHLWGVHEYAFEGGAVTNSLIGRIQDTWNYCVAHGIVPPRFIGTEGGWDRPGFKQAGKSDETYIRTVAGYWNDWWSRFGMEAMCLYAWGEDGESGDENNWRDYNHTDAGAAKDELIIVAPTLSDPVPLPEPNPDPEPEPEEPMQWIKAILRSNHSDGARVRAEPTVNSPIVARIPPEGIEAEYVPDREHWTADGPFLWIPVRVDGQFGYCRNDVITLPGGGDPPADLEAIKEALAALQREQAEFNRRLGHQEAATDDLRTMLTEAGTIFKGE